MAKKRPQSQALQPSGASRPLALPPPLLEASLARVEWTLGGRDTIIAALNHAPKSRDLAYLCGVIGDPAQANRPLARICAEAGITGGELLSAVRAGMVAAGGLFATKQVMDGLPAVVADVMLTAAPHEGTCGSCQGLGQVTPEPTKKVPNPEPKSCPVCTGTGRLLYPADTEKVKIALDLAQLTSKSGGVNVLVDQRQAHLHGESAGGTLEQLMAASDRLLYGEDLPLSRPDMADMQDMPEVDIDTVDAEVLPEAPEPPEPPTPPAPPEPPDGAY